LFRDRFAHYEEKSNGDSCVELLDYAFTNINEVSNTITPGFKPFPDGYLLPLIDPSGCLPAG